MKSFKLSRILLLLLFLACLAAFLRLMPFGSDSYLRSHKALGQNINISEPRYLVPREFVFPSMIGSAFGLLPFRDPHFRGTDPIEFSFLIDGVPQAGIAQGFDVNYRFSDPDNKKQILAVHVDGGTFKTEVAETCFACWVSRGHFFALGQTEHQMIFLIYSPYGQDYLNRHSKEHGLIAVDLPFGASDLIQPIPVGSKPADQLVSAIQAFPQSDKALENICAARTKPIGELIFDLFQYHCDWL
ncbi:MAG: hypothetical protein ACRBBO_15185 [Cognatishimia sp.]